ncbi:ribonuclease [Aureococcus anophagefferens]|uniref:Ribonuclease n=1 Tax=Aureococcus anophagefferens TaxID=44056 RepID=A0ABR1FYM0_AURAN
MDVLPAQRWDAFNYSRWDRFGDEESADDEASLPTQPGPPAAPEAAARRSPAVAARAPPRRAPAAPPVAPEPPRAAEPAEEPRAAAEPPQRRRALQHAAAGARPRGSIERYTAPRVGFVAAPGLDYSKWADSQWNSESDEERERLPPRRHSMPTNKAKARAEVARLAARSSHPDAAPRSARRPIDYSRWDKIDDEDDEDEDGRATAPAEEAEGDARDDSPPAVAAAEEERARRGGGGVVAATSLEEERRPRSRSPDDSGLDFGRGHAVAAVAGPRDAARAGAARRPRRARLRRFLSSRRRRRRSGSWPARRTATPRRRSPAPRRCRPARAPCGARRARARARAATPPAPRLGRAAVAVAGLEALGRPDVVDAVAARGRYALAARRADAALRDAAACVARAAATTAGAGARRAARRWAGRAPRPTPRRAGAGPGPPRARRRRLCRAVASACATASTGGGSSRATSAPVATLAHASPAIAYHPRVRIGGDAQDVFRGVFSPRLAAPPKKGSAASLLRGAARWASGSLGGSWAAPDLEGMDASASVPCAVKKVRLSELGAGLNELKCLLKLKRHANVVRVYGQAEDGDEYLYLALELCHGTLDGLANMVRRRSRGWPALRADLEKLDLVDVCKQMAGGLTHLHENGIIHRDIKPSNILWVARSGAPVIKLADFGISKALDARNGRDEYTVTSSHAGTVGYMAREFVKLKWDSGVRKSAKMTEAQYKAGDVFALGCCMYHVITGGRHPFGDYPYMLEMAIMQGAPPSLDAIPKMAGPHREVLARALIEAMLDHDARNRPAARTVQNHAFFFQLPGD